jgi:hypothetical protein
MSDVNPAWIMVGDLEKGFAEDNFRLDPVGDLAGLSLRLTDSDANVTEFTFETESKLAWHKEFSGERGTQQYSATSLRDSIYFIDYITGGDAGISVTLILDLRLNLFTSVTAAMPAEEEIHKSMFRRAADGEELTSVKAAIVSGRIADRQPMASALHHETSELIGKRLQYRYSKTECYEHIYLNQAFYTWHCLEGVEKGLADTERCHHVKISDNLYLFVWREKIVPTLGVIMIDLDRKKTTGKIFGYQGAAAGQVANFPVGAHATILNSTSHSL